MADRSRTCLQKSGESNFIPLSSYAEDTAFKLYMADVRDSSSFQNLPYNIVLNSNTSYKEFRVTYRKFMCSENLFKSVGDTRSHWTSGNTAEVDFVIQCKEEIVPIKEAKG